MKKLTFALMTLLAMSFTMKAQQYVSTEPSNRNAILEEFTGRLCGYCPDGHIIANQIKANNPDRFWSVNIHSAGSSNFSTDTYPNLNTTKGNQIRAAFGANSFPSGVVNRSTSTAQGRGSWSSLSNQQFNNAAECNVAGLVKINPNTRTANITVEVYYTGNSSASENYLTVVMLQDSIMGSQSSGSTNPAQWINGQYCHMHILRDIITNTMGDAISPTTQGTLITKTYEYQIPEVIGDPNGVEVKLEHLSFLAWVTEQYQGTPTRPILNANELDKTYLTDEPIYPMINSIKQALEASCGMTKRFMVRMSNIGTNTLNSLKFRAEVGNETHEFEWQGQLASGDYANIDFEMDIPVGTFNGTIRITEANGSAYQDSWSFAAENLEYTEVNVENSTVTLKLYIIQDVYGEQTTWDIINSAGEVVAQGGPYQHLAGSSGTQPNVETINNVPANECYLFRIFDSGKNGICCNYGEGHYYMKLSGGEKIFEGDGDFGAMASQEFSIKCQSGIVETEPSAFKIYPNPANNELYISSEVGSFEYQIVNGLGQVVMSGKADGVATVDVSELSGVYFVRFVGETTSVKKIIVR